MNECLLFIVELRAAFRWHLVQSHAFGDFFPNGGIFLQLFARTELFQVKTFGIRAPMALRTGLIQNRIDCGFVFFSPGREWIVIRDRQNGRSNTGGKNDAAEQKTGEWHRGEHRGMLSRLEVGQIAALVELSAGGNLSLANPVPTSNLNEPVDSTIPRRFFLTHTATKINARSCHEGDSPPESDINR